MMEKKSENVDELLDSIEPMQIVPSMKMSEEVQKLQQMQRNVVDILQPELGAKEISDGAETITEAMASKTNDCREKELEQELQDIFDGSEVWKEKFSFPDESNQGVSWLWWLAVIGTYLCFYKPPF